MFEINKRHNHFCINLMYRKLQIRIHLNVKLPEVKMIRGDRQFRNQLKLKLRAFLTKIKFAHSLQNKY